MTDAKPSKNSNEFKVGATTYIRFIHGEDSFVCVAGHTVKDKDYTWKVKVDKKTGKRFYVSLGRHGRSWTLQDVHATTATKPKEVPPSIATPQLARDSVGASMGTVTPPAVYRDVYTSRPERDINESITLLEVYKQRVPFNPCKVVPGGAVSESALDAMGAELLRLSPELKLTPEAVLSTHLSAVHYLQMHPTADVAATVQKLCYAIASDSTADTLASPFLEAQAKIDFLASINESVNKTISEQSFDLSVIRTNIDLREQERRRAATKLCEWQDKCAEADRDVEEATSESREQSHLVERHLDWFRTSLQRLRRSFPSDASACLAHVEKLKAELQEACNSSRSLQDSYRRVKLLRSSLHDSLASMSRDGPSDAGGGAGTGARDAALASELARSKDENAKLLLALSKASLESEDAHCTAAEVKQLRTQLQDAEEVYNTPTV